MPDYKEFLQFSTMCYRYDIVNVLLKGNVTNYCEINQLKVKPCRRLLHNVHVNVLEDCTTHTTNAPRYDVYLSDVKTTSYGTGSRICNFLSAPSRD